MAITVAFTDVDVVIVAIKVAFAEVDALGVADVVVRKEGAEVSESNRKRLSDYLSETKETC